MNQQAIILSLIAAAAGAYFLLRPARAYADIGPAVQGGGRPDPYGPPLPPSYALPTYTDPIQEMNMPRGIRNHNPMNLRYVASINWNGQIGSDDAGYARFDTVQDGIRAGVKNLMNGYFGRGLNTPRSIITRYAPSHENPTDSYVAFIADAMGISPDTPFEPTFANMVKLTKAIIHFENGSNPYREETIVAGVNAGMA